MAFVHYSGGRSRGERVGNLDSGLIEINAVVHSSAQLDISEKAGKNMSSGSINVTGPSKSTDPADGYVGRRERFQLHLSQSDLAQIVAVLRRGGERWRVLRRATILKMLDERLSIREIAGKNDVARKTVREIGRRYNEGGLDSALYEKRHSGKKPALDEAQRNRILALLTESPPGGKQCWTIGVLLQECVQRRLAPPVSRETIRVLLELHHLKPWRRTKAPRGAPQEGKRDYNGDLTAEGHSEQ